MGPIRFVFMSLSAVRATDVKSGLPFALEDVKGQERVPWVGRLHCDFVEDGVSHRHADLQGHEGARFAQLGYIR